MFAEKESKRDWRSKLTGYSRCLLLPAAHILECGHHMLGSNWVFLKIMGKLKKFHGTIKESRRKSDISLRPADPAILDQILHFKMAKSSFKF